LIFLEPKHGCGSPPRCHILLVVAKEPLLMDKNPGYPWVFGEIVVSLQRNNKRIMETIKTKRK
jgi:hypothetical protein